MKALRTSRTYWILAALIACCAGATPAAGALQSYSALYAFGDSLSDPGNAFALTRGSVPASPYFEGRFSNGLNFVDRISLNLFGSPSVPFAGHPGTGTNFAVGGAKTDTENFQIPGSPTGMLSQFALYNELVDRADRNALYVVYGGSNDLFDLFTKLPPNPADWSAARDAVIGGAMQNLSFIISGLAGLGARSVLLPNVADLGAIPSMRDGPLSGFATDTTEQFNSALDALVDELAGTGIKIYELNVFSAFEQVLANPHAFGFTNVTDACYEGPFTGGPPEPCSDPSVYLSWDGTHPTARAHQMLGDTATAIVRQVPEPNTLVLLLGLLLLFAVQMHTKRPRPKLSVRV